jgi:hypothetical protein
MIAYYFGHLVSQFSFQIIVNLFNEFIANPSSLIMFFHHHFLSPGASSSGWTRTRDLTM